MSDNYKSYYLNVAKKTGKSIFGSDKPQALHYCRVELPDNLTNTEAVERAQSIAAAMGTDYVYSLTYMERIGHHMWESKQ